MKTLDDIEDNESNIALSVIKRCAAEIAEHCDSVQIVAIKQRKNASARFNYGEGCIFQRMGATKYWLDKETHKARLDAEDEHREG